MILVTLGTQDKDFSRLLKAIDKEIENKNIKEKVIVQAGFTKYESKNMEIFDLIPSEELEKLVKKCDILITHGGVGSILMGIQNNKKIIAAARLSEYKEHTNNHQKQIISEFVQKGYILELSDFDKLGDMIKQIKKFQPSKFVSNTRNFTKGIEEYIEEENNISWYNKYRIAASYGYRGIVLSLINLLVFYLLRNCLSIIDNILISYILTIFIGTIFSLIMDIKYETKRFIITNIISLIVEFLVMNCFISILKLDLIISKTVVLLLVLIINILIVKFLYRNKR